MSKDLEELDVLSDFLMNAIANDPDVYMIIIANYDPFDEDSMVYTFENVCKEFPDLEYKDGLKFIYFNTTGTKNIKKAKKELLTYLNHSKIKNVTNRDIAQIHDYVNSVKQSADWSLNHNLI